MGFDRLPLFVIMDLDLLRDCCKALDNLYAMITKKKSSQLDITLTTELLLFLISTIGLSAFDEHSIIKKNKPLFDLQQEFYILCVCTIHADNISTSTCNVEIIDDAHFSSI